MEYNRLEKKYFFDAIAKATDNDLTKGLTEKEIKAAASQQITVNRADYLFGEFIKPGDKYLDDIEHKTYTISAAGNNYYEYLKNEYDNELLDAREKVHSIRQGRFSINVAYISLGLAALTALVPIITWYSDRNKTQKTHTEVPQLQQVTQCIQELQQNVLSLNQIIHALDTSTKKVKIVKEQPKNKGR